MTAGAILPTKREVIAELRKEIDAWRTSNVENDGVSETRAPCTRSAALKWHCRS